MQLKDLNVSLVVGAALMSSTVSMASQFKKPAVNSIYDLRCENDSLNTATARVRLLWAKNSKIIPLRTFNKWYYTVVIDEDTLESKVTLDPLPYYPTFGKWDAAAKKVVGGYWKPEAHGMPDVVPAPNTWIGSCRASCYTPYQQILTDNGYMEIQDALDSLYPTIATVKLGSTLESVDLEFSDIGKYVISGDDSLHDIVTLVTEDGGEIEVTDNHPLVDGKGYIREAKTFDIGDQLVTEDGLKVSITAIDSKEFYGQVYNYEPKQESLLGNIVVAQGFLNGSARYQSSYKSYLDRELVRTQIDPNLLP
ncbi:hypothetical protein [Pseudobacteriovorax antillogorgiicola]|uniref:Intein N-terminal splicing region n=1 Tax=Pseudobacteriovorax antillogorgiicola TaxID=1513793 RepID=A0A1Y6C3B3_9BACT|nr:hypothetical protein [Pseudobacteriovorax antillogorgiicola]TCS50352.1 intein [Pseudobacteriovorax antillogorgiicola]SMF34858.1 intein N-terminal splicing region [Pseudobacteriovorax antillogorgiicola]